MRWKGREESSNIEDRRGMALPAGGMALGGGLGSIVLLIILMLLGANPQQILQQAGDRPAFQDNAPPPVSPESDRDADLKKFVSVVMKDTEDVWNKLFKEQLGARYQEPKLVLFTGSVRSACGVASSQVGPFYCPGDNNVYLDFDFFRQLRTELGAPGDFAMAYVIAHEVAHHVQNQLGISSKVQQLQARGGESEGKKLSVRLELQADYLAGVWVHHAQLNKKILEKGDLEEALHAASRIGDDFLQKRARGYVSKESFTHGSSAQRQKYLQRGMETGDLQGMMKLFETSYESL